MAIWMISGENRSQFLFSWLIPAKPIFRTSYPGIGIPLTRSSEKALPFPAPSFPDCRGLMTCRRCPLPTNPVTSWFSVVDTPLTSGGKVSVTRQIFHGGLLAVMT